MDLVSLKDKLDEETYVALTQYITDLEGQRDSARQESIKHRQSLKAKVLELEQTNSSLQSAQDEMLARLGVDSIDALAQIDPKGQAEAVKQYEVKLKRLESQLSERQSAYEELNGRYRGTLQSSALRRAMSGHEWIDTDIVESYINSHLVWDENQMLYKSNDGSLLSLEQGLQVLAKERPQLLKTSGASGSGFRGQPASGAPKTPNPWAKDTRNLTQQILLERNEPERAAQLKAAAGIT